MAIKSATNVQKTFVFLNLFSFFLILIKEKDFRFFVGFYLFFFYLCSLNRLS